MADTATHTSIELDTCFEAHDGETVEGVIAAIEAKYGTLKGKVVNPSGPGGGWPIVEWTGPEADLIRLCQDEYDDGTGTFHTAVGLG